MLYDFPPIYDMIVPNCPLQDATVHSEVFKMLILFFKPSKTQMYSVYIGIKWKKANVHIWYATISSYLLFYWMNDLKVWY